MKFDLDDEYDKLLKKDAKYILVENAVYAYFIDNINALAERGYEVCGNITIKPETQSENPKYVQMMVKMYN